MSYLFHNCSSLEFLKLNFDTNKIKKMEYMLSSCTYLNSLYISTFNGNNSNNFLNIIENDEDLTLYINSSIYPILKEQMPNYIIVIDFFD